MNLKDLISPFYVWKRAFEKPYTTPNPIKDRPGAERYRGFHKNDMEKCIGCGTCATICQNAAIDMVPVEGIETTHRDSGLRPMIDYGRCCWCALCVDICTTNSLSMSNEYIFVDTDADAFRFIPGVDDVKWSDSEKGYKKPEKYDLLDRERVKMEMLEPDERKKSFIELVKGYSKEQAIMEASRCVDCGLCVATCPAHMDIPDYIRAIRDDDIDKALKLLYQTNPFSGTCGRICTHRCENVCSIGVNGDPLAIRWLKRYIMDQVETDEMPKILQDEFRPNGKKVAIVGAGPGGMSAAYYLITAGYDVTVYEAHAKGGGMIRYGVPEYRMPYDELDKDIDYIVSLGVKVHYNTKVGKDISFMELYNNFDAVFFSTGLDQSYDIGIPGEDLDNVIPGLALLDSVTEGNPIDIGKSVVVVGGGNVAMDAARTSVRLGAKSIVAYRRREIDMPADIEEIEEAHEEGVVFITQAIPVKIEKGTKTRLKFYYNEAEMVDQGEGKRPKPVAIEGAIKVLEVDTVIKAIGQGADYSFIPKEIAAKMKIERGKVIVDTFGRTGVDKVFAGGDIANRTMDAISAIADGHRAAKGIDDYLS